ncbi:MAG: enoyl-CoA hydratase/isomerase family protein, partial [Gemmataceae bacterium]
MTPDLVTYQHLGPAAVVTINRPDKRNALSRALIAALTAAFRKAADDPAARCVIITGGGPAFCAGGDMAANSDVDVPGALLRQRRFLEVGDRLLRLPKPTVAAVNGAAIGAGFSLALLCD